MVDQQTAPQNQPDSSNIAPVDSNELNQNQNTINSSSQRQSRKLMPTLGKT